MSAKKKELQKERPIGQRIFRKTLEDCMHDSMVPYAEYVILDRALPRIEDGLKPVQRRVLYTMSELSLTPDKPHKKSARVVGDCLGKYHPHGDTSVYDAMARLAQSFSLRAPLADGHGNFGSIDGDSPAAMRYTEVRMAPLALELLRDIEKDTVRFELNFDDSLKEPFVLPSRFPNVLVNGASGIAVGLATNIPPHNLGESIDACIAVMKNPDISLDEIMEIIPAPDFPTGGYIIESDELKKAYETGRGKITVRAKTHFEPQKNGKTYIVITEIPYQMNKAALLTSILNTSQAKRDVNKAFSQINDIRDESDKSGLRAVIELKKDAEPEKVLQALFKYTPLQTTCGANMVVIADGRPQQLGIVDILKGYIKHQEDVVRRRTKFDLDAAEKRKHILDGFMLAIINLDEVIRIIRASATPKEAKQGLIDRFEFSEIQAQAILDLRLQRLTNLELVAIKDEAAALEITVAGLREILGSHEKLINVIITEMSEIRDKYADARRTEIISSDEHVIAIDEPVEKPVFDVTLELFFDADGDVRLARRPVGTPSPDEQQEIPQQVFTTQTDKALKLFTSGGDCITIQVDDIPEQQKTKAKSRPVRLAALIPLQDNERIIAAYIIDKPEACDVLFYMQNGNVKRTCATEYVTKKSRVLAMGMKEGDTIVNIELISHEDIEANSLIMITKQGMSIRFAANTVPAMGRSGTGVKCIKTDPGDYVIFAQMVPDMGEILIITDRGYAKRSLIFDYDIQGRNGKGVKTFDFKRNASNGTCVIAAFHVMDAFDIETVQLHGTQTIINTDAIVIERRLSAGRCAVISVLDDVVISAKRYKKSVAVTTSDEA